MLYYCRKRMFTGEDDDQISNRGGLELVEQESEDEDVELQADRASSIDRLGEQRNGASVCYNDRVVDNTAEETEEEKEVPDEFQDEALEDAQYKMDVQAMVVANESRRRRERRQ